MCAFMWNIGLLFSSSVFGLGVQVMRLMDGAGKCSLLLRFLGEIVWGWCYFSLECLVEFTSVAIWARRVLFFRFLTTDSVSLIVVGYS